MKIKRTTFVVKMTEEELAYQKNVPAKSLLDKNYLICTSCDGDLRESCRDDHEVPKHPILGVPYCGMCTAFYNSGEFSSDEDGEEKYCRWCGQGGTIFMCSSCTCGFCPTCIEKNIGRQALENVKTCDDWDCLICDISPLWKMRHFVLWASKDLAVFYGNLIDERSAEELRFSVLFRRKYKELFESETSSPCLSSSAPKASGSGLKGKKREYEPVANEEDSETSGSGKNKFEKVRKKTVARKSTGRRKDDAINKVNNILSRMELAGSEKESVTSVQNEPSTASYSVQGAEIGEIKQKEQQVRGGKKPGVARKSTKGSLKSGSVQRMNLDVENDKVCDLSSVSNIDKERSGEKITSAKVMAVEKTSENSDKPTVEKNCTEQSKQKSDDSRAVQIVSKPVSLNTETDVNGETPAKKPRLGAADNTTSPSTAVSTNQRPAALLSDDNTSDHEERNAENDWGNESTDIDSEVEETRRRAAVIKSLDQMIELIRATSDVSIGTLQKATRRCERQNVAIDKLEKRVRDVINLLDGTVLVMKSLAEEELKPLLEKKDEE